MSQKTPHRKTLKKLLSKMDELSPVEVDLALEKLLSIKANLRAPALGVEETALLQQINAGMSEEEREELDDLIGKREAEELKEGELERLIELTEIMENLNVERMQLLADLSAIRNVSIRELMKELQILAA
ncbi:MAG: hypothetical protein AAF696_26610 [Bacteroidota bacterium]